MSAFWDRIAVSVLGFGIAANGLCMLVAPALWYGMAPGALQTGPLNPDLVRDVGAAYLAAGAALLWFALDVRARAAALIGGAFLIVHLLIRGAETLARHGFISVLELLNLLAPAGFSPPLS